MFTKRLFRNARLRALTVGVAVAALSVAALPGQLASAQNIAPKVSADFNKVKPTVVLVHGAWADASSWKSEILSLQEDGYAVVAPPNPLRGLREDSGYLRNYLGTVIGPIVLVGHSYGGAVITNAATGNPNVKALVFVDAFLPAAGEAVAQLPGPQSCLAGNPATVFNFVQDPALPAGDVDAYLKIDATTPSYPGFAKCFANGLSASRAAELAASQRPAALTTIGEPSGSPAWLTIPSWDLIGTADHVLPAAQQSFMATRAKSHISHFNAGHLGLISQPDAVVEVILEAIDATS